MNQPELGFRKSNLLERLLNKDFGALVGIGLGLGQNYLLEVRDRKIDRVYSIPVDLLEFNGGRFLVAPRGHAQWICNTQALMIRIRKQELIDVKF